jgi:hypothetical protein
MAVNPRAFWGRDQKRDAYFDFHLPTPAKIAAEMLTPGYWGPFKIYLTSYGNPPSLITKKLAYPASNRIVSSQKQKKQYFFVIITILELRLDA